MIKIISLKNGSAKVLLKIHMGKLFQLNTDKRQINSHHNHKKLWRPKGRQSHMQFFKSCQDIT